MNKRKRKGASLVYVLVVLSIILSFSAGFVYFVTERGKISFIREKGIEERTVSEKYLSYMEEINSERIKLKGININGKREFLNDKGDYFNRKFIIDGAGGNRIERLIFLKEGNESIGNFKIEKIIDDDEKIYGLPLSKNTVYKNLKITYSKKMLDKKIDYVEEVAFRRKDSLTVEIIEGNGKFILK